MALLTSIALVILVGCVWGRYFQIEWEEEVALRDGRVIVVHVSHTYERISGWSRFDGAVFRDTELRMSIGEHGQVTQLFKGFSPLFIDQYQGVWYAVLYGGYRMRTRELPGQDWGEPDGPYAQWALRFESGAWRPISMVDLPDVFQRPNMLLLYGSVNELASMDGRRITLQAKNDWLRRHPPNYAHVLLARPLKP